MKKYICLLLIFFLFSSHTAFSVDNDQETNAADGKNDVDLMTKQMNDSSYILKAVWVNSYTIEITFHPQYIELYSKKKVEDRVKYKAQMFYMLKDEATCARGLDQDGNELAYSCAGTDGL